MLCHYDCPLCLVYITIKGNVLIIVAVPDWVDGPCLFIQENDYPASWSRLQVAQKSLATVEMLTFDVIHEEWPLHPHQGLSPQGS